MNIKLWNRQRVAAYGRSVKKQYIEEPTAVYDSVSVCLYII